MESPEGADVADDINRAGLAVLQIDDLLFLFSNLLHQDIHFIQALAQSFQLCIVRQLHLGSDSINLRLILGFFCFNLFALLLQALALFGFLTHLLTNSALFFFGAER